MAHYFFSKTAHLIPISDNDGTPVYRRSVGFELGVGGGRWECLVLCSAYFLDISTSKSKLVY